MRWRESNGARTPAEEERARAGARVDEALEAGRVTAMDPEDRVLQELVLTLVDEAPQPRPAFQRELDDRVAAGFPRERTGPAWRLATRLGVARESSQGPRSRRLLPRRPSLPALAGAATALVALLVAGSLFWTRETVTTPTLENPAGVTGQPAPEPGAPPGSTEPGAGAPSAEDAGDRTEPLAAGRAGSARPTFAPSPVPPPPDGDVAPGREHRQVERSAQMTLAAPEEDLQRVGEGIATVADRRDGFLLSSSLSTGQGGSTGGSFEVRVPVDELEATIADLSRLAEVRALTQSGEDLTAQVVTAKSTAERARAQRAELERKLAAADSEEDEQRLRERIRALTFQLRAARTEAGRLDERTSFATVWVTLVEGEGAQGTLGGALDDMVRLLEGALALALRVLGVALPIGLVVALAWAAARAAQRRRRESVLA